ncbi:MAG TPA: M13 family metallopeptidase [Candidatus Saccharimonadales bacterium]|nr:M13 family metallopeptidase [Candidatus Saccharimonadales bacterium]
MNTPSTKTHKLDTQTRPQDDFFGFVNNRWIAENPMPPSESRWGSFNALRNTAWEAMKTIYEELGKKDTLAQGSIEQQARDLYYTGTHKDELEKTHLAEINSYLAQIDAIQNTTELAQIIGTFQAFGAHGPWRVIVDLDEKDSTQHILRLHQTELTLPDRDYYLEDSDKMKSIRQAYTNHLKKVFGFFPQLGATADDFATVIMAFETELAAHSRSKTALRDIEANYNKTTYVQLQKNYPTIDWPAFATATGWQPTDQISVDQPEFLQFVHQQFTARPLEDWKSYLKWQFLVLFYSSISERFAKLKFEFFGKVLSGTSELMPLWKRVTLAVDEALGDGVGKLYVERHFSKEAKHQVLDMVEKIRATYKQRIEALSWMTAPTKAEAKKKLANMKVLIGYPDQWRDFSTLHIGRDSYVQNLIAAEIFNSDYWLQKIGKPTSRDEWLMFPQTVNAYHDPNRLVICFPAAILQPPFFSPEADVATNFGGIGTVIGHELTHGFDDQGCQFDEKGNIRMWQKPEERTAFDERAQYIIDQADNFEVLPGLTLKGKLVIGESIADLGGLELALAALHTLPDTNVDDGLARDQRFFVGYAATECDQTREEKLRELALSDPHPNAHFRVNGILQHIDAFYTAFNVMPSDKLYRAPEQRAKIW